MSLLESICSDNSYKKLIEKKEFFFECLNKIFSNLIEGNLLIQIYGGCNENLVLLLNDKDFEKQLTFIGSNIPQPIILQYICKNFEDPFKKKLIEKLNFVKSQDYNELIIKDKYIEPDDKCIYNKVFHRYLKIYDSFDSKNFPEKVRRELNLIEYILKEGAFRNNPEAKCYLGHYFQFDNNINRNVIAFKLIKDSYDLNFKEAIGYLAAMYIEGIGTKQNIRKGLELYENACNLGNYNCMHIMGVLYLNGTHVRKDYTKAYQLLHKAHIGGNVQSSFELAMMFKKGLGVKKNLYNTVLYLTSSVIVSNCPSASYELGIIHLNEDKYLNTKKGVDLINYASESNHLDAMCLMAEFYYKGKYIDLDVVKSISLLNKAKEMGHKKSEKLYKQYLAELNNYL